ncbi:MAG: 6-phosphogluconolactonase [Polyangiaceae bacterium]|nr:6-phosphogluconolactonase [Polyangiaceae bacterium]
MSAVDLTSWEVSDAPLETAASALQHYLSRAGDEPRLAIAGGTAAGALRPLNARIDPATWQRLRMTWVDERRVPLASPDSNRGAVHRQGWLGPHSPVGREIPLWLDGESPAGAVARATRAIAEELDHAIDVLLLGMGEDGHVASLFPGHPALAAVVPIVCVDDAPKPPPHRITMSLPLLSTAAAAVVVATGLAKREALQRLRDGDRSLPIARVPRLHVITDQRLSSMR